MSNQLWHYTLSTGHGRWSPRLEVSDAVIDALAPLVQVGRYDLPIEGYEVVVPESERGLWVTVQSRTRDHRPLATIVVMRDAADCESIWPWVEKQYHSLTEMPGLRAADYVAAKQPAKFPACVAWPILATPEEAYWLGDLERCLAWAWLESDTQQRG